MHDLRALKVGKGEVVLEQSDELVHLLLRHRLAGFDLSKHNQILTK